MVIGQVIGGLGNQMFQYAFYKYLASIKSCELKLDLSLFDGYSLHNGYELKSVFGIAEQNATQDEITELKSKYLLFFKIENKLLNKNLLFGKTHFKENKFHIDSKIFEKLVNDLYVEGYFQTYKYIKELDSSLFEFQTEVSEKEESLLQGNVVSIHVRGGDYITSKEDNRLFGNICTAKYYYDAIEYIKKYIENPVFLVFTNDKAYAKQLLNGENFQIVDWNSCEDSFRDMYLMSLCKHNIIANSSFSWWGAWLNKNSSKIVIAPKKWFNDSSINQEDIVPKEWIRIAS
jgi:hypothetical protein